MTGGHITIIIYYLCYNRVRARASSVLCDMDGREERKEGGKE
jgi:hypothetical protein